MKVIVAGGRDITNPEVVERAIADSGFHVTEVVSGCAPGVDTLGEAWAAARKIPVRRFPADWQRFGRSAGPRRNDQMAEYAEAAVTVWDGQSRGTKNMIETAKKHGLRVHVHLVCERRT